MVLYSIFLQKIVDHNLILYFIIIQFIFFKQIIINLFIFQKIKDQNLILYFITIRFIIFKLVIINLFILYHF